MSKVFHIGCQSWQYEDWVTKADGPAVFYPRGTRPVDMLSVYAEMFDTLEIDSTAYGTPRVATIEGWTQATPDNFLFSVKVPRAITHEHALGPACYPLMDEFVEALAAFGKKLGITLIQFPASFEATKITGRLLREFIERLPTNQRFAIEFRHESWFDEWTFSQLNGRRIALALVAGKWIDEKVMMGAFQKTLTDFAYLRFMGLRDLESFERIVRDRTSQLASWKSQISRLHAREVFIYVDNYYEGHAPETARKLMNQLRLDAVEPEELEPQGSLF